MTERNYNGSYKFDGMVSGDVYKNFQRKIEYEQRKEASARGELGKTQEAWLQKQNNKGMLSILALITGSIVTLAGVVYFMLNF
jgi:uncharacterized protein YecT (DUF1311 family)